MEIFLGVLFLIVCVLLIVVVLIQKGKGGGLGAAFGGAAASAFGTRVGDVFTWVTIVLVALFLLLAVGTTMVFRPKAGLVATPYFRPAPSEYTDYDVAASVEILCATLGAEVYYSLDGSEPSKDGQFSQPYQSAVRVEAGTTIKARAYRQGDWQPSLVAEAYYGPPRQVSTTAPAEASPTTAVAPTTQP